MKPLLDHAQEVIAPYQDSSVGMPDPSFVLQLPDDVYIGSNLYAVQKLFDGPFQFDIYFDSGSVKQKLTCERTFYHEFYSKSSNRLNTASVLDQGISALVQAYGQRFRGILPYPSDYPIEKKESLEAFSKAVTSSLVAGVGYFHGTSIVDRKFSYEWDEDEDAITSNDGDNSANGPKLTEPKALLTATPSRSFFPRGFYW